MTALVRSRAAILRISPACRVVASQSRGYASEEKNDEAVTHTGQQFAVGDFRKVRFIDKQKLVGILFFGAEEVTSQWAIDMVAEEPVVVCEKRVVFSDGGGPLGHPRVYLNLDPPGEHICGYSGRRFVHKRYYDEAKMGHSITYDQYLEEVKSDQTNYPV